MLTALARHNQTSKASHRMSNAAAGLIGQAPGVIVMDEKTKYTKMWDFPQYRAVAPGQHVAPLFLQEARPKPGSTVTDFGAGTGRGAMILAAVGGLRVRMLDFAENCLDPGVKAMVEANPEQIDFTVHDLTQPSPYTTEYGYCCDVMEHIPKCQVNGVIANILLGAQHVFFQIACEDDVCGALIGHPLHLSVHPYEWWLKKLQEFDAAIHWSKDYGTHCCFYVTAWQKSDDVVALGILNVEDEQVRKNVEENLNGGWLQISPHETNSLDAMILGGGPSMKAELETIKQLRAEGVKLITLNGAYNWAVENGLEPSAQIIVDARPFNARFVKPIVDGCKYLLSSQCDPSVFEGMPKDRTFMWHTSTDMIKDLLQAKLERWWIVPGGSTVLLRAIPLMRMLGYKRFHLFGCDSCVQTDHHSYPQPENDNQPTFDTIVGGRVFHVTTWMLSQAREFCDLVKFLGEEIDLEIHGDGLLKHIVDTGAGLADEAEFSLI
jgi:hypothetical protein